MRHALTSILFLLLVASLALACEAVTHANDFGTSQATVSICASGTLFCDGACVPQNAKNCTACGAGCDPGQLCSDGACGSQCTGGTSQCSGADGTPVCVDTQNDPANCGRCGGFPDAGACPICQNGSCTNDCELPSKLCKGKCIQFDNDPKNCGNCGHQCDPGQVCSNGQCGLSCGTLTECNGSCVDTSSDAKFCGLVGCGVQCSIAPNTFHGAPVCVSGVCTIACENGFTNCLGLTGRECVCGTCPVLGSGGSGGSLCPKTATCVNGQCVGAGGH